MEIQPHTQDTDGDLNTRVDEKTLILSSCDFQSGVNVKKTI